MGCHCLLRDKLRCSLKRPWFDREEQGSLAIVKAGHPEAAEPSSEAPQALEGNDKAATCLGNSREYGSPQFLSRSPETQNTLKASSAFFKFVGK